MADLTVAAVPGYFATMGAEHLYLRRRAERTGAPARSDYEKQDTVTSLTMGVGSLLAPMVMGRLLRPITPGRGRWGRALVGTAAAAAAVTTVADVLARWGLAEDDPGDHADALGEAPPPGAGADPTALRGASERARRRRRRRAIGRAARRVAGVAGVAAVATGGTALTTWWADRTSPQRLWRHRLVDLGEGAVGTAAAMVGWDLVYYWNHRLMHEHRALWAIHVVHHSSERYNLSTALRQPVADAFGVFVPYGLLSLLGVRPSLVAQARGVNLLYQYWIHTDAIRTIGPAEEVFNSPSLHRVHHGSNRKYLDRNHGGILIVWDRLFGTHQVEEEPVVYGLTKNVDSFSPVVVATHEHRAMLANVGRATTWHDRLSHLVRGPGWSPAPAA